MQRVKSFLDGAGARTDGKQEGLSPEEIAVVLKTRKLNFLLDDGGAGSDGEPEGLSPEEIAVVLKMQDDRNSYIPKTGEGRRGEAEMEMVIYLTIQYGPCCEKTCLRGFRKSEFETFLLSYRE